MTVASLWKALDAAGSGTAVGMDEIAGNGRRRAALLPPRRRQQQQQQEQNRAQPGTSAPAAEAAGASSSAAINNDGRTSNATTILAVDLSIWICESLTSRALEEGHANPATALVFARAVRLLSNGVGLVFVVEGKRRIRAAAATANEDGNGGGNGEDTFRRRRGGTAFWRACRDCRKVLELLGVPVVQAKAEGEALCALLSLRGVVDGVISNDGDCLLFGAKTVYTKFSIDSLENSRVFRYDLDDLRAAVPTGNGDDEDEADGNDDKNNGNGNNGGAGAAPGQTLVSLSRQDLIAFALLTGSDLAGSGLSKVGHKKAVRFIRKCQLDNPLRRESAAIEEMKSWARAAAVDPAGAGTGVRHHPVVGAEKETENQEGNSSSNNNNEKQKKCSRCSHPGCKRSHEKNGCELCGTEPGEPCYELTSDDRFRKSLREKALRVDPPFEPSQVLEAYLRPNDNQLPMQFHNAASGAAKRPVMAPPRMRELLRLPVIIKGRDFAASRAYVKQAVARLLARNELFRADGDDDDENNGNGDQRQRMSRERPVPRRITRFLTQSGVPSCEVSWVVGATLTDDDGEGVDGYEYSTIEPRELIENRYPSLVESFHVAEKERKKQGDAEQERRRAFLESIFFGPGAAAGAAAVDTDGDDAGDAEQQQMDGDDGAEQQPAVKKDMQRQMKKREGFFQHQQNNKQPNLPGGHHRERKKKKRDGRNRDRSNIKCSDDVVNLLGERNVLGQQQLRQPGAYKELDEAGSAKILTSIVVPRSKILQAAAKRPRQALEGRDDSEKAPGWIGDVDRQARLGGRGHELPVLPIQQQQQQKKKKKRSQAQGGRIPSTILVKKTRKDKRKEKENRHRKNNREEEESDRRDDEMEHHHRYSEAPAPAGDGALNADAAFGGHDDEDNIRDDVGDDERSGLYCKMGDFMVQISPLVGSGHLSPCRLFVQNDNS